MIGSVLVDDCYPSGQQKKFRVSNALLGFAYGAIGQGSGYRSGCSDVPLQ